MSPYWGATFFSFLPLFFQRMFLLLTGRLALSDLASDEIQVLTLGLISIGAALIGTVLVLRKMTMLANALSHTILIGIVVAYLLMGGLFGVGIHFRTLFFAALLCGILTSLLTQLFNHLLKLQEDASIGLVFTSLFALGIVLATLFTRNAHIGLEVVMGNVDGLHFDDLKIALFVAGSNLCLILLFYKEWKLLCFDQGLAASFGVRPSLFGYLLMLLASMSAISAFRAVGVLLFLAFLVGLPLIGRLLCNSMGKMLAWAATFGFVISLLSVALSRHFLTAYQMPLSTAGLATCLIGVAFLVIASLRGLTFTKNSQILKG